MSNTYTSTAEWVDADLLSPSRMVAHAAARGLVMLDNGRTATLTRYSPTQVRVTLEWAPGVRRNARKTDIVRVLTDPVVT